MQSIFRLFLILIFISPSYAFFGIKENNPNWMVRVTKKLNSDEIFGTGYLVKINNEYYVRTASHITLGTEDVILVTGANEALEVISGQGLIDNARDDQFIKVKSPKKSKALGFYSPNLNSLVVYPEQYRIILKSNRRRKIEEGLEASFYVLPIWSQEKSREYRPKNISLFTHSDPGDFVRDRVRLATDNFSFIADIKVNPGESGSPVFKQNLTSFAQDTKGEYVDYNFPNSNAGAVFILGHVQNYNLFFERSNFSSPKQTQRMVDYILSGKTGRLDRVEWMRFKNIFYRVQNTNKGLVQEIINQKQKSYSGTKADGGSTLKIESYSGTKADGGTGLRNERYSGTKADGGETSFRKNKIGMGMIYHDQPVVAFRLIEGDYHYFIYADWENYQALLQRQKEQNIIFTPMDLSTNLTELITERTNYVYKRESCILSSVAMAQNYLKLFVLGFETLSVKLDEDFFPIHKIKHQDSGESFTVDLRGLFSVDLTELSSKSNVLYKSEIDKYLYQSYITLKKAGHSSVKLSCFLGR